MKRILQLAILGFLTAALPSCGGDNEQGAERLEGGILSGGVFRLNETNEARSLYPLDITEVTGYRIANQVYEGLVKFDQATLEVVPGLATEWSTNADASEWTFKLRKGVKFHDDPCFANGEGREFTAEDVYWCATELCKASPRNQMYWLALERIEGAKAVYNKSFESPDEDLELEGVEVLDDYTVKFKLRYPFADFPQILAHNGFYIYPKEAKEYYGKDMSTNAVGTGPFQLKLFKPNELAIMHRNESYWAEDEHGNQLPYLEAIQVSFIKDKKSELLKFKTGELDMVFTLPIEMYSEVMGKMGSDRSKMPEFEPQIAPSMSVNYYAFNHTHEVFADRRVRKAFNMAVDRNSLVKNTLQGEGKAANFGLVPPAFSDYPHKQLNTIGYDPEMARSLMTEAGYPDGEGFPVLTLEVGANNNNELVAQVVSKMLSDNLGIEINIKMLPIPEVLDNSESGRASFWRDGWIADYPNPENFLQLFVSDEQSEELGSNAYLNSVRYKSELYDSLYHEAIMETDRENRMTLYLMLDQILIDEAVVMPLYYEEFTRLVPLYVKNFPANSMEYRDLTSVWMEKP